jgi:hypothetical protein
VAGEYKIDVVGDLALPQVFLLDGINRKTNIGREKLTGSNGDAYRIDGSDIRTI